jgi:hypothetical protein
MNWPGKQQIESVRRHLKSIFSIQGNGTAGICWNHTSECLKSLDSKEKFDGYKSPGRPLKTNAFDRCTCNFGKFNPAILKCLEELIASEFVEDYSNRNTASFIDDHSDRNTATDEREGSHPAQKKTTRSAGAKFRATIDKRKAESVAHFLGFKTNCKNGKERLGRESEPNSALLVASLCEKLGNSSSRSLWGQEGVISNSLRRDWKIIRLLVNMINDRLLAGEEPLILPEEDVLIQDAALPERWRYEPLGAPNAVQRTPSTPLTSAQDGSESEIDEFFDCSEDQDLGGADSLCQNLIVQFNSVDHDCTSPAQLVAAEPPAAAAEVADEAADQPPGAASSFRAALGLPKRIAKQLDDELYLFRQLIQVQQSDN